jgi:WD40 repeat protein
MEGKFLYLACEDGSIKVVKAKKHAIELTRTFPRTETRCLCLAISGDVAYAGYADSSIRKWDLKTGESLL